ERTLLLKVLPLFSEEVFKTSNKDRVLNLLTNLIVKIGGYDSYLDMFAKHQPIIELVVKIFNESTYLSRALLSLDNLESIFEYPDIKVDRDSLTERLATAFKMSKDPLDVVREYKSIEELRIGTMFLLGNLDIETFSRKLSVLADTIVKESLRYLTGSIGLAVIGLGRMGASEMNIGSDLDLIFASTGNSSKNKKSIDAAGNLIKLLSDYTARGTVYKLDMRLRPDGSKGILVNNIKGYENYYMNVAHPWEIQALLRARVVSGNRELLKAFNAMRRNVIIARGHEVNAEYVLDMRRRIVKDISKEKATKLKKSEYDLKHGPGGLEEIQFMIQYLQLRHVDVYPDLITHKTATALKRLLKHSLITSEFYVKMQESFRFLRTVEALIRMNDESVLKRDAKICEPIASFLEFAKSEDLFDEIDRIRNGVVEASNMIYGKEDKIS
ncbi:MAG: hypothetical protein HY779_05575, partial [Rubrobacteridae bacterium]|nr:hypothetical protein [Rubrobacteridae bacterium]